MHDQLLRTKGQGESLKEIAYAISKDPTTISKEVCKHRNKVIKDPKSMLYLVSVQDVLISKNAKLFIYAKHKDATRNVKAVLVLIQH